jgi:DNA repair protein RecO (recombination protein O)
MPQLKSEGIVLKSTLWKENSKIVTVFTDNAGRQTIIDRGGRSLKSKRGRLMSFTRLDITYFRSERSGTGYISEVEPLETFAMDKGGGALGRLAFASAALELLNDLLPDNEPQEELYLLTIHYLRRMDIVPKNSIIPLFLTFFLKLLSFLGYRPNFAGCVSCGRERTEVGRQPSEPGGDWVFAPERGGVVCPSCQTAGEYYIKLQSEMHDKVYNLQIASLAEGLGVKLKLAEAERIMELLIAFARYQTQVQHLKSLAFLEKLKKTNLKI